LRAAFRGSEQIGSTIISLTVSLIAVLILSLFMGDVGRRAVQEFAITLSVTIFISAVVSLTLVPMACARLLSRSFGDPRKRASALQPWKGSTKSSKFTAACSTGYSTVRPSS